MEKRGIETHDLGMRRPASRGVSRSGGTFDVADFLVVCILARSMFCSPQGQIRRSAKWWASFGNAMLSEANQPPLGLLQLSWLVLTTWDFLVAVLGGMVSDINYSPCKL